MIDVTGGAVKMTDPRRGWGDGKAGLTARGEAVLRPVERRLG